MTYLLRLRTICLLVLAGCAAYVTANEYGDAIYANDYGISQLYDDMVQPTLGYLGSSKPLDGLFSRVQADSGEPENILLGSLLSFLIKLFLGAAPMPHYRSLQ